MNYELKENYLENIDDLISRFEGLTYYGSDGALRIKQWLASAYITSAVSAAVWLEKQQRRVNHVAEANPFAEFDAAQADAIDEVLRQPEERYDSALPKAQFFWYQLGEKQRPILSEIGQRFLEGRADEAYYEAQLKVHGLTREQAEEKRKKANIAMNAPFTQVIASTFTSIMDAPRDEARFTHDDWVRFLERLDRYCNTFLRFYVGEGDVAGRDQREHTNPAAWMADIELVRDIQADIQALLKANTTEQEEVPEADAGAHRGTIPEVH